MAELPTGTVTFLFTDIEGSTKLLHELGDGYADALAEHRIVLRRAFAEHGGAEVDTQGDAFFVAFSRARDAIAAAADAQRKLAQKPVRVRMGIHTGEPLRTDEGYVGMDIHRAARIAAAGHGGQVLVSQTARDLVAEDLPDELALHDLGPHRLKDLSAQQQIFQLVGEGLEREFPALTSLESRPTNLPPQPTRLIGRDQELAEVGALLRSPEVRLLTVTGPGGAGKTRLVLQAAADLLDDFGDGVFFVGLAGVDHASSVVPAIARALGVREAAGSSVDETLGRFVRERELLLVLDNLEHVLDVAPTIHELVLGAPSVKAISSSRAPLRVSGEREYPIPSLDGDDAVLLFSERARAIKPDFVLDGDTAAVVEICRRLDRLPLAIELAAARAKVLSPTALLERLEQRLSVLTGGARDLPDRQRTLRDTIAWSYELLDPAEQTLFSRLAVFVGRFTIDAAEQVCDADLDSLASLVEKSLVRQGEDRFRMLETIREYAMERLEASGELDRVRRKHSDFFLEFADKYRARESARRTAAALDRLESEHDNLRAALQHARDLDDPRLESRLTATLADLWEIRGYLTEGLERCREALGRDPGAPAEIRGRLVSSAGLIALKLGDYETTLDMAAVLDRLYAATGDENFEARAFNLRANVASVEGRFDQARDWFEQAGSIQERLGDRPSVQSTQHNLGLVALEQGDYGRARAELELGLASAEEIGSEGLIANSVCDLGFALLGEGDAEQARGRLADGLERASRLGWKENVAYCLIGLSSLEAQSARSEQAGRLLGQVGRILEETQLNLQPYAKRVRTNVELELGARLGEGRLEALLAEGRSLSLEDAVAEALAP